MPRTTIAKEWLAQGRVEGRSASGAGGQRPLEASYRREQRSDGSTRVQLGWADGLVTYHYDSRRDRTARRIRATKELMGPLEFGLFLGLGNLDLGFFFGALRAVFGPPHDLVDKWKGSSSYEFRVDIDRRMLRQRAPRRFVLRLRDHKGGLDPQLREPVRGKGDWSLRRADAVVPPGVEEHVVLWLLGFLEGFAETAVLQDFERTYPRGCVIEEGGAGEERRYRYGVRGGVPFDDLHTARSVDGVLDPELQAFVEKLSPQR